MHEPGLSRFLASSKMAEPVITEIMEPVEIQIAWWVGFSLSVLCLLSQILIFNLIPCNRRTDMAILTQITIARLVNVISEYALLNDSLSGWSLKIVTALHICTDCALVCWIFVFSVQLHQLSTKFVVMKTKTFCWMLLLVWLLSLSVGSLCFMQYFVGHNYLYIFYKIYVILKFVMLSVNLLIICRIFYMIIQRTRANNGNLNAVLRTCLIISILLSISWLVVFITDLMSYLEQHLSLLFCVINSYFVIIVMSKFVISAYSPKNYLVQMYQARDL